MMDNESDLVNQIKIHNSPFQKLSDVKNLHSDEIVQTRG